MLHGDHDVIPDDILRMMADRFCKSDMLSKVNPNEPEWLTSLCSTLELPETLISHTDGMLNENRNYGWLLYRDKYISKFGYPVLTKAVMKEITESLIDNNINTVLEVCAGTGWLSYNLQKVGIRTIATDNLSWEEDFKRDAVNDWADNHYCDVISMDAAVAIKKYHEHVDCIAVSWPPYMDPIGLKIFKAADKYSLPILYIGESEYGCCGSDNMWKFIGDKRCSCELEDDYICPSYVSWPGIHDRVILYTWTELHK